jgi:hypothetical protein
MFGNTLGFILIMLHCSGMRGFEYVNVLKIIFNFILYSVASNLVSIQKNLNVTGKPEFEPPVVSNLSYYNGV